MGGGYKAREPFKMSIFSVVSMAVCGRERATCVEESGHVSRSLEGWEDFAGLYILLSLSLTRLVSC